MESNSGKMLVDPDSYAAEMERRFQETAGTSKWYGVYQARKAAFEARKQAAVSQAAAPLRPISTSPPRPIAAPARRSTYVVENSHAESEAARTPKAMSPSWPEELARSARKAALVAKRKAAEKKAAEKKAAEQKGAEKAASAKKVAEKKATVGVSASSPEVIIDSDSDGAEVMLSAWQPRKKSPLRRSRLRAALLSVTRRLSMKHPRLLQERQSYLRRQLFRRQVRQRAIHQLQRTLRVTPAAQM
jgi:flagellar biosynthesis GTPase FlhF